MNQLYYGDNLQVLRESVSDESVDLIYLDPPFNSKRDYNLLCKSPKGHDSEAQIEAFKDSWHWGLQAEREFDDLLKVQPGSDVTQMLNAFIAFVGRNDMTAYLVMMASRLLELKRVLKPAGSLYLHCDSTASHYLKLLLDAVFGKEMFQNEIIWKRSSAHSDSKQGSRHFGRITDTILFYTKSELAGRWNPLHRDYDEKYISRDYSRTDPDGRKYRLDNIQGPGGAKKGNPYYEVMGVSRYWRYSKKRMQELIEANRIIQTSPGAVPQYKRYLDEMEGMPVQNLWDDIPVINNRAKEFLGYPTQKPLALLERILMASSEPGDVILDPFCGCGTAVHAAQKLGRNWIGIDITHLAISLIEKRLKDAFGAHCEFTVEGTPKDLDAARDLAKRDKYQFQWWAVSLVDARPFQGKKKGADGGIDGLKFFRDLDNTEVRKIVVSVKGGGLKADDVRSLNHVREREKAEIALFISLETPTSGMVKDAASAGIYTSVNGRMKMPRVQLLTIAGLLDGTHRAEHPDYEPDLNFKKAKAEARGEQTSLL